MTISDKPQKRDGRRARTDVTRREILNACRDLLVDGRLEPTADEIAERAGVTSRTLFRHFSDVESLHREIVDEAVTYARGLMSEPLPDEVKSYTSWLDKVVYIIDLRIRLYESLLPIFVSPVFHRYRSRFRPSRKEVSRRRSRLHRLLPKETNEDKLLLEAIDATLSIEFWICLRVGRHLSIAKARKVLVRSVQKLNA